MNEQQLIALLKQVKEGSLEIDTAITQLRSLPFEDVGGFARLDHHRAVRCGFPEVVFGEGKSPEHLVRIVEQLSEKSDKVLVTRLAADVYAQIKGSLPEDGVYDPNARIYRIDRANDPALPGILVLSAGTSDIPVAEEAAQTAELSGNDVKRICGCRWLTPPIGLYA